MLPDPPDDRPFIPPVPGGAPGPERPGGQPWGASSPAWGGAPPSPPGQAFGQAPPPGGGWGAPPAGSSGKATAALVLGICGLAVCPLVCSVLALVFGYQGRAEIDRSGGAISGRAQATAGIVLGWVGVVLCLIGIALLVALAAMGELDGSYTYDGSFQAIGLLLGR